MQNPVSGVEPGIFIQNVKPDSRHGKAQPCLRIPSVYDLSGVRHISILYVSEGWHTDKTTAANSENAPITSCRKFRTHWLIQKRKTDKTLLFALWDKISNHRSPLFRTLHHNSTPLGRFPSGAAGRPHFWASVSKR